MTRLGLGVLLLLRLLADPAAVCGQSFVLAASVNGGPARVVQELFLGPGDRLGVHALIPSGSPRREECPRWLRLAPEPGPYSNLENAQGRRSPGFRAAISYAVLPLDRDGWSLDASQALGQEPGACYLTLDRLFPPGEIPAAFSEARALHRAHPGQVLQVVRRADDSYLGLLAELMHTPFLAAPMFLGREHQTDLRLGSDCAAFAVYGRRRLGEDLDYAGPRGILRHLLPVGATWPRAVSDGHRMVFHWPGGEPVAFGPDGVQAGDLLHFQDQVSVLYADQGAPGVLDEEDMIFHSWDEGPQVVAIRDTPFAGRPFRIFRWPEAEASGDSPPE